MTRILKFKKKRISKQAGERARLKVEKGPDRGCTFILLGDRTTIGRGESNDIVLSDLKSSRDHAEISFQSSLWSVKDLRSANGVLLNGQAVNEANIESGDRVSIGETVFQFTSRGETSLNYRPLNSSSTSVSSTTGSFVVNGGLPEQAQASSSKGILVLILGGVFVWFLFAEDPSKETLEQPPEVVSKPNRMARDLGSYLPQQSTDELIEIGKSADVFFRLGFREFRERNYLRARKEFETVLQINPTHSLARLYLNNCIQEIRKEVKFHLDRGKKSFDAGKLRESKGHYESILRLLHKDRGHPAYSEAQNQLKKVTNSIRGGLKRNG